MKWTTEIKGNYRGNELIGAWEFYDDKGNLIETKKKFIGKPTILYLEHLIGSRPPETALLEGRSFASAEGPAACVSLNRSISIVRNEDGKIVNLVTSLATLPGASASRNRCSASMESWSKPTMTCTVETKRFKTFYHTWSHELKTP